MVPVSRFIFGWILEFWSSAWAAKWNGCIMHKRGVPELDFRVKAAHAKDRFQSWQRLKYTENNAWGTAHCHEPDVCCFGRKQSKYRAPKHKTCSKRSFPK